MKFVRNILRKKAKPIPVRDGFFNAWRNLKSGMSRRRHPRGWVVALAVVTIIGWGTVGTGQDEPAETKTDESSAVECLITKAPANGIYFSVAASPEVTSPDTKVRIEFIAVHVCKEKDTLELEKIEVCRDDGTVVATLTIPEQFREMQNLAGAYGAILLRQEKRKNVIKLGEEIKQTRGVEEASAYVQTNLKRLDDEIKNFDWLIRTSSFGSARSGDIDPESREKFPDTSLEVDLKDFKDDLKAGDKITVRARGYFTHGESDTVLEVAREITCR